MSYFIFSIEFAGLSDRPPVSNVTPLPTRNRCESPAASVGFQLRRTSRGGLAEPLATLSSEPAPSASSAGSSSTSTSNPAALPIDSAMSANSSGPRSFAGVSTSRRVTFTDSPTMRPASNAPVSALGATIKISSTAAAESSLLYFGRSYPPYAQPSATARTSSPSAKAIATRLNLRCCAARTAWPAMRNAWFASSASPTPSNINRLAASSFGSCRMVNSLGLPAISPDSRSAAICASAAWPSAPPPANGSTMASHSSSASGPSCRLIFIKRTHHPGQTTHCKAARFFWVRRSRRSNDHRTRLAKQEKAPNSSSYSSLVLRYREGTDYEGRVRKTRTS